MAADSTTQTKVQRTEAEPTPGTSTAGTQPNKAASDTRVDTPSEDTLSSSSSEDLPNVPL